MPHRDIVHHASGNPGYKLSIVSSYWDGKGILSLEAAQRRLTCTAIEHDSILFLHLVSLSYLSIAKGSDLKRETAAGKASARAFVFLEGTICLTALKNYSNLKHITGDWCEWRSCFPDWCSGLNWMHCDFFTISLTWVFFMSCTLSMICSSAFLPDVSRLVEFLSLVYWKCSSSLKLLQSNEGCCRRK